MNGRPLDTLFSVLETEYGPLDASETTLVADAKKELAELRSERDAAIRERDEAVALLKRARIALTFYGDWMIQNCPQGNHSTTYPSGEGVETDIRTYLKSAV